MDSAESYIILTMTFPILGGIISYLLGNNRGPIVSVGSIFIGFLFALRLFLLEAPMNLSWDWLPGISLGWYLDQMAIFLISLVYFVSLLVHIFSLYYLKGDSGISRYYFKLGFFTFSMLGLLLADHFILLFLFWELVGFSSYLLIGFWYTDKEKSNSARIAFMVNRVADAALLVGVILMVTVIDQPFLSFLSYVEPTTASQIASVCLVLGAFGKSAQFPFMGWLPKAMAGPTPVSALIHAATMVAAGVYLLIRLVPFLSYDMMTLVAFGGGITALMAAYAALTQYDIKSVLAYSTISQLGFMVLGVGVGAYQASLFHLWTHAFFKAGLFLAAGVIIHFMQHASKTKNNSQDMRSMGGLQRWLPITSLVFIICGLALSGLPFFSGFLSKEGILSGAWIWASSGSSMNALAYLVPSMAFIAALLTPIYIGRQILLVFFGQPRSELGSVRESEPAFLVKMPLILLALGSLWFFNALSPFNAKGWWFNEFLFSINTSGEIGDIAQIESWTFIISIFLSIIGLAIAYLLFRPGGKAQLGFHEAYPRNWYQNLSYNAWYIQNFYGAIALRYKKITSFAAYFDLRIIDRTVNLFGVFTIVLSKFLGIIDREVVDGLVNLFAWISRKVGVMLARIQSERSQTQITWLVIFLVIIILGLQMWNN